MAAGRSRTKSATFTCTPAAKFGKDRIAELFPDSAYRPTHNALFPKDCMHIENLGGRIDAPELQNRRLALGCFPWKFKGGEAAFARVVAFDNEWKV